MSVRENARNALMPPTRVAVTLAALAVALALAGCGSVKQAALEQGHTPAYAEGYDDGCASGEDAAGDLFAEARKNTNRYGSDSQYTQGWDEGFETCRRQTAGMVEAARRRNPSRDN